MIDIYIYFEKNEIKIVMKKKTILVDELNIKKIIL